MTDIDKIGPAERVNWPRVMRRREAEDDQGKGHDTSGDEQPPEENEDPAGDDGGRPHIDIRV